MKRVLIIIFLSALIITSCTININQNDLETSETQTQTENLKRELFDGKNFETVFSFSGFAFSGEPNYEEKQRDTVLYSSNDKEKISAFKDKYLRDRGMFKETPDEIFNIGGNYYVEYYNNQEKRKSCYVSYFASWEDLEGANWDGIFCAIYSWDDLKEIGYIVYDSGQNGNIAAETLYSETAEPMVKFTYDYFDGVPFPFITAENYIELTENDAITVESLLNRNQKFWFYKDFAVFDKTGKVTRYDGELQFKSRFSGILNDFLYDEKGRLKEIQEKSTEENKPGWWLPEYDYPPWEEVLSTDITFGYREDDTLSELNYNFFYGTHATTDFSGKIRYDEKGRMIYREYYITHGRHYCVYLYDGESARPFVVIEFCNGAGYGDEDDYFGTWAYGVMESPMLLFK